MIQMRPMPHNLAKTVAFGGIMAAGLGSAQAASAGPAVAASPDRGEVIVPCSTPALDHALASTSDGQIVVLADRCTYGLGGALPDPTKDLTIIGRGATFRPTANNSDFTILTVDAPVNLSITGVNFVNGGGYGADDGGAIYNEGGADIRIQDSTFLDNSGSRFGGAIWNQDGTLTVIADTFTDNTNSYGWGGAIMNQDNATVSASTFSGNYAMVGLYSDAHGGAIYNAGNLWVYGTSFTGNMSDFAGGAVYNVGRALLARDSFRDNSADGGGAIYNDFDAVLAVTDSAITGNTASYYGGGGIADNGGTVTVTSDLITGNQPDNCDPVGTIPGCSG
jgi:hypothetical protein